MKTEGALHRKMSELAIPLTLALLAVVAIISIWTPLTHPEIAHRWFTFPNIIWFMPVPLLVLVCCWGLSVAPIIVRPSMGRFTHPGAGVPRVQRPWDQHLAEYYSTGNLNLAGRFAAAESGLYAGRRIADHSGYFDVHLLELLRVPRQNQTR